MGHPREWGFIFWLAVGFLMLLGFVSPVFVAPIGSGFIIGLGALIAGLRWGPPWPADLGLLAGAGAGCLVIALVNAISGDLSPTVWALVGVALTGTSGLAFWRLRDRPQGF